MEWSSLVSVVPISTGRRREVPRASKALTVKSLGSLFSHLGLQDGAVTGGLGDGASISSLSIVLGSSIVNTVNLFTGDWGTLIAGCAMQNPLLPLGTRLFNRNRVFQCQQIFKQLLSLLCGESTNIHVVGAVTD